ncbi:MAG: hypothetical protein CMM46_09805 [Rhodospirillaceae bacterium]|nr:hypothetical protein [Rhodospirillaceae bacterium]|tara:strand:+ start:1022 stop:1321 length:300 start_codon:yes stop_codon:yes gene_type:complete
MYDIDPDRTDLLEEFDANPRGPYSPDLAEVVKRLRTGALDERHLIVCTKRGEEWAVGRWPAERGEPVSFVEGGTFSDYDDAARLVFRLRWQAATGRVLD